MDPATESEPIVSSAENDDVIVALNENGEEVIVEFAEPIDFGHFDEYELSYVVQQRIAAKAAATSTVMTPEMKRQHAKETMASIESILNFKEDEPELAKMDEFYRSALQMKMQDALVPSDAGDGDAESVQESEGSAKSAVTPATTTAPAKVDTGPVKWVDTAKLPTKVFDALRPNLALEYPFELDDFQKQAVMRLEKREHVFVAAHTSAGKTVVAEYAIALALKNNSRAVYTSPIKALSNQKYRDFKEKFGAENVGIVTGDVSVNPKAQCLIVTTEIFRSMLYKGADTVRDIEFVIFDEVHYVNDAERGVVWEEVIIMLPEKITLIFLSATTPNAAEFSDWIGRTKRHKVYLITTDKRPVPLQHYIYHDQEMYRVLDGSTKQFNAAAIQQCINKQKEKAKPKPMSAENQNMKNQRMQEKANIAAQRAGGNSAKAQQIKQQVFQKDAKFHSKGNGGVAQGGPSNPAGTKQQWLQLIKLLQAGGREASGGLGEVSFGVGTTSTVLTAKARAEKEAREVKYEDLPADLRAKISKKEYEKEARDVRGSEDEPEKNTNGLLPVVVFSFSKKKCEEIADYLKGQDFLTSQEKSAVATLYSNIITRLNPDDADLPQVQRVFECLRRGIGIHHGGLLPILKETVEILFSQSVVKVLLATETFAMGVNMPARVVIFNGWKKHDGRELRELLSGEYIQMAGRAGRRGLDTFGTVILAVWVNDPPEESAVRRLLTGPPTILLSKFRLRYNMILNLVRVNNLSVADMIKQSFTEFASQKMLSSHNIVHKLKKYEEYATFLEDQRVRARELQSSESAASATSIEEQDRVVQSLVDKLYTAQSMTYQQLAYLIQKKASDLSTILSKGRLVYVNVDALVAAPRLLGLQELGPCFAVVLTDPPTAEAAKQAKQTSWGAANKPGSQKLSAAALERKALLAGMSTMSSKEPAASTTKISEKTATVWVMLLLDHPHHGSPVDCSDELTPTLDANTPATRYGFSSSQESLRYLVMEVALQDIAFVLDVTIPTAAVGGQEDLPTICDAAQMTVVGNMSDLTLKDLRKERVTDIDFVDRHVRLMNLWKDILRVVPSLSIIPYFPREFTLLNKKSIVGRKLDMMKRCISDESLSLFPDFQQRLGILSFLGYLDRDTQTITTKGRVACELNSCDELLGTEYLFHNVLEPLNPPEAVAMLSALVFQEKSDNEDQLTTRMEVARTTMRTIYEQITQLQEIEGIEIDADSKPPLNFGLCAVTYQWARGVAFKDIMAMTQFQEGTIVRAITRLDELCRDVQKAAQVMGNPSLYRKMEAASQCIKRDIVFAASLYVNPEE